MKTKGYLINLEGGVNMVKGSSLLAKAKAKITGADTKKAEAILIKKLSEINGAKTVVNKLEKQLRVLENLDVSDIAEIYTDDLELDESLYSED